MTKALFLTDDTYFELVHPEEINFTFKVRPAKNFGPVLVRVFTQILLSEAEGSLIIVLFQNHTLYGIDLVLADPFDGCSALRNMDEIAGSIALIQRGYDANV